MNRANVGVLPHTPALLLLLLLFSEVAFFLSPCVHCGRNHTGADVDALGTLAELRELRIIPIVYIITTLVSMAFAQLLGLALMNRDISKVRALPGMPPTILHLMRVVYI